MSGILPSKIYAELGNFLKIGCGLIPHIVLNVDNEPCKECGLTVLIIFEACCSSL